MPLAAAFFSAGAGLLCSSAASRTVGAPPEAARASLIGWSPGVTCPAGAFEYDGRDKYGEMGFEWVGDVVGYPTDHIGNPESCCQTAGGDGIGIRYGPHDDIGLFYSMCNPTLGCMDTKRAYTCTVCECNVLVSVYRPVW